jgi:2,5-diketo-D-gluconate reductase B
MKKEIPAVGLGTWQMESSLCQEVIPMAFDIGYRHIDTAFAYYNEEGIGRAIGHLPREQLWITTKLWKDFHPPSLVEKGLHESLSKLKTDYVDLYLIHWPESRTMIQTLEAMIRLSDRGHVRFVGICNATMTHLRKIKQAGLFVFVNQIEYHPYLVQQDLLDYCEKEGIRITAYCPIAKNRVAKDLVIQKIAKHHHVSEAQVTLRWLLGRGAIVIPKGSNYKHLEENWAAPRLALSDQELTQIDALNQHRRIVVPDFHEFDGPILRL